MNGWILKLIGSLVEKLTTLTNRQTFLVALAAILLISFTGVFDHALWTPDEPRDAEVGREMLVSGDFVVPTLAGKPFLEKPPLYWWAMAGMYRLFGVSDGVARSTSALAAVMTLLLVFDVARRIANPFAGLMATIVTGTMSGFYLHFHRVVVDPWLALFVMLGYWGFVVAVFSRKDLGGGKTVEPSGLGIFVTYLAGGLAFLVKGPVGPGLVAVPLVVVILVTRRWNFFRSWVHVPGILVFLALCLWWPLLLYFRGGKELLFDGFVIPNIFGRISPAFGQYYEGGHAHGGHAHHFWYYLQFPSEIIPWVITLPAVGHWLWRKRWPLEWNGPALVCLASLLPIGVILLSIPETKRMLYLLPLFAPLGVVIGAWVAATVRMEYIQKIDRYTHIILLVTVAFAILSASVTLPVAYFSGPRFFARFHALLQARPSASMFFMLFGLLVIMSIGLITYGMRLWEKGSPRLGLVSACLAFIFFVCGGSLFFRMGDGIKNLHYFPRDLQTMKAISPELIGYCLDETTMGFIPYDTGFVPQNITTTEELDRYIVTTPRGKLLILERSFSKLPDEVRSRLQVLRCWHFGEHRSYCLYAWGLLSTK